MVQHVHHVRTADAIGVVQPGLVETALLQIGDAPGRVLLHVVLAAEDDGPSGAGLYAGWLKADGNAVGTQRALVGLLVLLGNARDVEGATGDAVAAADAVVLVEVDDTVGVLNDRSRRRAGLEAARVRAVHAAVLADQPLEVATAGVLVLGELHHRPGFGGEVDRVVVGPVAGADFVAQVVPFRTRHLAGLAADALGGVDQFRHFADLADRRPLGGRGGAGNHVLSSHHAFSTLTRNDLNSGVWVLASPTNGVSVLVR